jgi:hypothetical protein
MTNLAFTYTFDPDYFIIGLVIGGIIGLAWIILERR